MIISNLKNINLYVLLHCPMLIYQHPALFQIIFLPQFKKIQDFHPLWLLYKWINKVMILIQGNLHEQRGNMFAKAMWLHMLVYWRRPRYKSDSQCDSRYLKINIQMHIFVLANQVKCPPNKKLSSISHGCNCQLPPSNKNEIGIVCVFIHISIPKDENDFLKWDPIVQYWQSTTRLSLWRLTLWSCSNMN